MKNTSRYQILFFLGFSSVFFVSFFRFDYFHIDQSLKIIMLRMPFIFFAIFFVFKKLRNYEIYNILFSFILGNLIFILGSDLYAAFRYVQSGLPEVFIYSFLVEYSGQSSLYISFYLFISIVFYAYLVQRDYRFLRNTFLKYFVFIVFSINILLLFSRLFVALYFLLIFILFLYSIFRRKINISYVVVILSIIGSIYYFMDHFYFIQYRLRNYLPYREMSEYKKPEDRVLIWQCASELITIKPYFGYKIGNSLENLVKCYSQKNDDFNNCKINKFNAHNQYLELSIEVGVILTVFVLLSAFIGLFLAFYKRNYIFICVLCIVMIFSIIESIFMVQSTCYFVAFFLPLLFKIQKL
jgi:hypothetical protein